MQELCEGFFAYSLPPTKSASHARRTLEDFAVWYSVPARLLHGFEKAYPPTDETASPVDLTSPNSWKVEGVTFSSTLKNDTADEQKKLAALEGKYAITKEDRAVTEVTKKSNTLKDDMKADMEKLLEGMKKMKAGKSDEAAESSTG